MRLQEGDELAYAIHGDRVVLTKSRPLAAEDPFGVFGEWDGVADRKAYADL